MGLAMIVGGIALVPLTLAVHLYGRVPLPVTLALGHAAAAGLAVAAAASTEATARATTRLLGKDARSGRISALSKAAWWPYHLGLQTKLFVQWRKNKGPNGEPLFNNVTPRLSIGGWPKSAAVLPAPSGPKAALSVVDVTCELPRTHETGGGYLCLPTWGERRAGVAPVLSSVSSSGSRTRPAQQRGGTAGAATLNAPFQRPY